MFYTIGEMARKLNVAPSTLRYYDKEGLLPFVERSSGGIRMFKDEDMEWLRLLGCLKKAGMPLKEIRSFLDWSRQGDATISQRLEDFSDGIGSGLYRLMDRMNTIDLRGVFANEKE